MEKFLNLFDQISLFDLIYILITILSLIKCYKKGFVLSLLSASKWLLAYVITLFLFPKTKPYVEDIIDNEYVLDVLSDLDPDSPYAKFSTAEKLAAEGGDPNQVFTNKRKRERVFRREMGEPEFWQTKEDRAPARPAMTQDEEREITNRVQIPTNQMPKYEPQNILTPGFGGASNYETGIDDLLDETKQKLDRLKNDPDSSEDEIEMLIPPAKGRKHVLRLVRELLCFKPQSKGTNISNALEHLNKVLKRKSIVVLASDFYDKNFEKPLQLLNQRHEVLAIGVEDPRESELPSMGLIELEDPETGESHLIDSSSRKVRKLFAAQSIQRAKEREDFMKRLRVDWVPILMQKEYKDTISPLVDYFRKRQALGV